MSDAIVAPAEAAARVRAALGDAERVEPAADAVEVTGPAASIVDRLARLRDAEGLGLSCLVDLTAVAGRGEGDATFVVYLLLAPESGLRARVRVAAGEGGASVPSVAPIHPAAAWLEREVGERFGLCFGLRFGAPPDGPAGPRDAAAGPATPSASAGPPERTP